MSRRILIVDDSGSMRQMLAQASQGIGDVEVAEVLVEAFRDEGVR